MNPAVAKVEDAEDPKVFKYPVMFFMQLQGKPEGRSP
jgi:hypothetical protein